MGMTLPSCVCEVFFFFKQKTPYEMRIGVWSSDVCSSDLFARRVHVWHLRGLAADQRAAGQLAAFRDAADHGHGGVDIELAGGEVVEEEQRLGALHQHVVDAHADQVAADRVAAARKSVG